MGIKCCNGCVPPKRHTACLGHCPEYLKEKADNAEKKAEEDKQRKIEYALDHHVRRGAYISRLIREKKG